MVNSEIEITIATPVEDVIVETSEDLVAGDEGKIVCTVKGGRPAPIISLDLGQPVPEMINDTISQIPGWCKTEKCIEQICIHF